MSYRIGEGKKMLILGVAGVVDLIEIVLLFTGVGTAFEIISGILQYGVIWIMFATSGVVFFGTNKRIKRQISTGILESIPGIGVLPIFTWTVWKTIKESREEDEQSEDSNNINPNILREKRQVSNIQKSSNIIRPKKP